MKKLIIQIILAGIIIFLGYKCYESIKIPQQFKVIKENIDWHLSSFSLFPRSISLLFLQVTDAFQHIDIHK